MKLVRRRVELALLCALLSISSALADDRFFDSNGVRIHYVEQGSGKPIVLLHGSRTTHRYWIVSRVMQNLAQDYRVIAFDARGSAKSDKPHDVKAYGREMGLDVIRLLDHLGIRKAHIVGYSMGAHVTAQLLTSHPERFITATLGAAAGLFRWDKERAAGFEQEAAETERECVSRSQIHRLAPADAPRPDDDAIERRSARCMARPDIDRFAWAARMRSFGDLAVTPAQMTAIPVPVLSIVGSLDDYLEDFAALKRLRPDMKMVVIDGATHGGQRGAIRRPEFVAAIREFLAAGRSLPSH
jgi:pimeloyl-ACP methyl ester carboxylesterase